MTTTAEFRRFALELEREIDEEFLQRIDQIRRKMGLQGLTGVVRKSPVKTGQFRSNWMVDMGTAGDRVQDNVLSEAAVIAEGSQSIAQAPTFSSIVIYNALPYAEPLEEGSSQQAPLGMVSVTAAEIESQFRRIE